MMYPKKKTTTNQVAIVTGATGTIGTEICRALMLHHFKVFMIARDEKKASHIQNYLQQETGVSCQFLMADLSSQASIKALSDRWDQGSVDLLINNAAICPKKRTLSAQGIELQWATNVLGYFWMMIHFRKHLKKSLKSKIINVASYWAGDLDLNDPEFSNRLYQNNLAYRQSKQANRMLTSHMSLDFLKDQIFMTACHPGDVHSNLSHDLGFGGHETPHQAAATPIWLATTAAGFQSGTYFEYQKPVICQFAKNLNQSQKLFELCQNYSLN